jgi:hypothetical protein
MSLRRLSLPKPALALIAVLPLLLGAGAAFGAQAPALPQVEPTQPWAAQDLALPTATRTATFTATPSPTATPTATYTATPSPTVTPSATLTPTLTADEAFNADFPTGLGSKLSLHFVRGSRGSYKWLQDTHPRFVKLVDAALAWSPDLRREFPDMLQIGRVTDEDHSLERMDPIRAANHYVESMMPFYQKYPDIDYWEGWNEWNPHLRGDVTDWQWYAQFDGQRACLMQHYGYQAVIGNFSAGRPEFREMLLFVPALRLGFQCGAILGLHEYSAPTLQYGYGLGIPNRPNYPDRGMLTFRYRYWYEDILKPLNLPLRLAITEFGIDGGIDAGRPGPRGTGGWQDYGKLGYWKDIGLGDDPAKAYVAQLAWYDSEMRKDPYVIGAAIYTAGSYDNVSFESETLLPELTNYMVSVKGQ